MSQTVFLNGKWLPIEEAMIPVLDRGFIYGDGVYELIPVYAKKPFRAREHLQRLANSLAEIRIDNPYTESQWLTLVDQIVAKHPAADQAIYFQVTRGAPLKRDHVFPVGLAPTVFMMSNQLTRPTAAQYENGVACVTLNDDRWFKNHIKSISLLGNVLARQHAADRDAVEVVMFRDGWLTEASSSNVLIVRDGVIAAPRKDNLILSGITYGAAYDLAREIGHAFEVRDISAAEVWTADELWLTSSTKEALAITALDGKAVGAQPGKVGPVFRKMYDAFQRAKL